MNLEIGHEFKGRGKEILKSTDINYSDQRCPNCDSIFINDDSCDTCGIIFKKQGQIQELLGPKSFFEIKGEYLKGLTLWEQKYSFLEKLRAKKVKSYLRKLLFRFDDLTIILKQNYSYLRPNDKILLYLELEGIIREIFSYRLLEDELNFKMESLKANFPGLKIKRLYQREKEGKKSIGTSYQNFFSRCYLGGIRLGTLVLIGLILVFIIGISQLIFPILLSKTL